MTPYKWLRLCGTTVSAALVFSLAVLCLGSAEASAATCTVSLTTDTQPIGVIGELRYCLNNFSAGDTIDFSVTGKITLTSALPSISQNVTITGPGANQLTISGGGSFQVFSIGAGTPTVSISGLKISGGSAAGGGAAISQASGSLTVTGSEFANNSSSSIGGGAIYAVGSLTVRSSTFTNNSAVSGTAGGAIYATAGLTITNSTFYGNTAAGNGGAIAAPVGTGITAITNNTFSGNSANSGGAIYNDGTLTANNNIFTGNSAFSGGGILNSGTGTITAASNNLMTGDTGGECSGGSGCPTNGSNGNQVGSGIHVDLSPLEYYGGTTKTFLPQPGSQAICAGSATLASTAGLTADQRGFAMNPSYSPCSGSVDIGAVQANYIQVQASTDAGAGLSDCQGATCTLRDAIALANSNGYGDIDFAPAVSSITLSNTGTLTLSGTNGINIIGPGASAVTVNGGGGTSNFSVFTVNASVPALIYGLTVSNGNTSVSGGGINNSGTLTVVDSTISGNSATSGGGIANSGTLQIAESTVSGNSASSVTVAAEGGGIWSSAGSIGVVNSTIAGNSVSGNATNGDGGGIFVAAGSASVANTVVSANTSNGTDANIGGAFTDGVGNVIGGGSNATNDLVGGTGAQITLSPLQLNGIGATARTLIPLPGSPAICAGESANIASGLSTDERGYPLQPTGGYCPAGTVDAGAVQTNYTSVNFVQQPSTVALGTAMSPAPTVNVLETDTLLSSSNTDAVNGIPITLTYSGTGTLSGNTATTAGGVATFGSLEVSANPGTSVTLGASVPVTPLGITPAATLTATSSDFNAIGPATALVVSAPASATAGTPFSVTVTAQDAAGNTATGYTGTIQFTSSDAGAGVSLPANYTFVPATDHGVHTFTNGVKLVTAGGQTVTAADTVTNTIHGSAIVTVGASTPAVITATSGTPQSTYVRNAFATALKATVTDASLNPVSGATVTFTAPGSGASATLSNAGSCTTAVNGACSVSATANATAGGPYNVTAAVTGFPAAGSASFALTNTPQPSYLVTVMTDDAPPGTASNCVDQNIGGGNNSNCSLRDALAAAAASGGANITFASSMAISVSNSLTIPPFTSIKGLTELNSSIPNGVENYVSVNGFFSTSVEFVVNSGTIGASIANLNIGGVIATGATEGGAILNNGSLTITASMISGGESPGQGGGIANNGTLVVTQCLIYDNTSLRAGGGIFNAPGATLTVTDSTFSNNTAPYGGGIFNGGTLTAVNNTISGNTANDYYGGIEEEDLGTLTYANNIVSGNTVVSGNALYNDCGEPGCPVNGVDGNLVGGTVNLSALSVGGGPLNGGPTGNMIPIPGSTAICAGLLAPASNAGLTTDQRGLPITGGGYCPSGSIDSGAVQTNYSLFFAPPPTTPLVVDQLFGVAVAVDESGFNNQSLVPVSSPSIALTTSAGTLKGTTTESTVAGVATYSGLDSSAVTNATLTATLILNPALTPAVLVTTAFPNFTVAPDSTTTAVTLTSGASTSTVDQSLTFTARVTPAGPPNATNHFVPSGTVSFAGAAGIASACPNAPVTDNGDGTVSATCTVSNLAASATPYSITATYSSGDGNFSSSPASPPLSQTVNKANTTTAVTLTAGTNPSAVNGSVAFTATVAPTNGNFALGSGSDTVTFTNNGSVIANCGTNGAVTLTWSAGAASATATCTTSTLIGGSHSVVATYSGDSNFGASAGNFAQTVNPVATTTAIVSTVASVPSNSAPLNTPVTYSATVTPNTAPSAGSPSPTGTITFQYIGTNGTLPATSTNLCPAVALTAGSGAESGTANASCVALLPTAGTYAITGTYNGDQSFVGGASSQNAQTVTKGATTTSVVSSSLASSVNQSVSFTATVAPSLPGGTAKPTGTVSFVAIGPSPAVTQAAMCSETIANGSVPVCNYAFPASGTYTVVATYNVLTDPNFTTSSSPSSGAGADVQTVSIASNSVVLSSTQNPSTVNQLVTFNVTISVTGSGAAQPTGTVTYLDGGTTLCTLTGTVAAPFTGGIVPACTVPLSSVATHSITATYSGDSNFAGGTSNTVPQVVNKALPTTVVVSSPNPAAVNGKVTATATVTPPFTAGTAVPSGTVVFATTPATTTCTETIVAGVVPPCTFTFTANGNYNIVATYKGDGNFLSSPSGASADIEGVGAGTTSVSLTSSSPADTSVVNQSVTFAATIGFLTSGAAEPTGTVTYFDGATTLCKFTGTSASPFTGGAVPTCTVTLYTAGTHAITASYSGDTNFTASNTSLAPPQVVNQAAIVATVKESVNSEPLNTSVTYSATVVPNPAPSAGSVNPTGTVTFQYVGTNGTLPAVPANLCPTVGVTAANGSASASCAALLPTAGTYAITATYNGDPNFKIDTSSQIAQNVTKGATTTSVVSSTLTSSVNQSVSFTATVAPSLTGGTAVPTGSVSFVAVGPSPSNAQTPMCTEPITSGAVPVCSFTFTASGTYTVVATYNVLTDPNFTTNSSPSSGAGADVQTVSSASNSVVLLSTLNPSAVNQLVTFNATINVTNSGKTQPTGTVIYLDGATQLCTFTATVAAPFAGGVVPACTVPFTTQGTHSITASYSGDSNFAKSTASLSPAQVVNTTATATSVTSATNPSVVNASVIFTATVTPAYNAGKAIPTGTVSFSAAPVGGSATLLNCANTNTKPITVTPGAGGAVTATCSAPLTAAANYTVTATYTTGDTNFASSPGTIAQQVSKANLILAVTSSYVQNSTVITSPPLQGSSLVNQALTFTATITIPTAGTPPVSTVTFNDTSTSTSLCPDIAVVPTSSPTIFKAVCVPPATTQWVANTHTIVATYNSGDPNFASVPSPVFKQVVTAAPATETLTSSKQTSVATQTVIFTATIIPTLTGPVPPSGDFEFTTNGVWAPQTQCQSIVVTAGTAVCTVVFPATAESQTITATYEHDSNFANPTSSIAQTVQNFTIVNSVTSALNATSTAGPVFLTQGYSTATPAATGTDPFNPTTVQMVVMPKGGFSDTLGLSCQVTNAISGAVVADPSCTVSTTASGANDSGTPLTYTVTSSPSTAIGEYAVTLTATDNLNPTLVNATTLTVYLVGQANILSLAQGASGTETVNFNTTTVPASLRNPTLVSFSCVTVWNLTAKTLLTASQIAGLTCTGPASVAITGGSTPAAISISTLGATTAMLRASSTISMAAFLGLPLFALMGWVGSRKSPRKNFFRFLGLILLLVGVSYASGCGGSFTSTSKSTSNGIAPGSYLVQVVGTDQNGNKYYAVVPLDVSAN